MRTPVLGGGWRRALKNVFGPPTGAAVAALLRLTRAPVALAVIYHSVSDRPGDPRTQLVAPIGVDVFSAQLKFLQRHFDLVAASEIVATGSRRRRGQRIPAAVTFDDDLQSHVSTAMPSLLKAGAPATFFVCGASLDEPFAFWWERLQRAYDNDLARPLLEQAGLDPALARNSLDIHALGQVFEGLNSLDRDYYSEQLATAMGGDSASAGLRASDLLALCDAGYEIGFHTVRHDILPVLTAAELDEAMSEGREKLEAIVGPLDVIAYPHGYSDDRVAAAARRAGFALGFTASPTAIHRDDEPLLLGRIDAGNASAGELGWTLAVALVRRVAKTIRARAFLARRHA